MRSHPFLILFIFILLLLLTDGYTYRGIRKIVHDYSKRTRRIIAVFFWFILVVTIFGIFFLTAMMDSIPASESLIYFHYFSAVLVLFYGPKFIFFFFNLADDIIFFLRKLITRLRRRAFTRSTDLPVISRRKFINQAGIILAVLPFPSVLYGIFKGRFNFIVRGYTLTYENLPGSFDGLRMVQISDFHLGSFIHNENEVRKAVNLINEQKPDLILFTGDMVNNVAEEVDSFKKILNGLKASLGKYSILGNHDYGEYIHWRSEEEKEQNLRRLIQSQREIGFDLLLNESRRIETNGEAIELIGVENWGLPPFPQYGDLDKALEKTVAGSFKILLSHDPTHWDAQVLNKTAIDLTLSGHTHGAQFGIEIPGWRWSPVSLRYKRWGGLYEEGKQKLYVNTGIGFIGFPGRVGMPPEITVFELKKT